MSARAVPERGEVGTRRPAPGELPERGEGPLRPGEALHEDGARLTASRGTGLLFFLAVGVWFGFLLVKSEAVSWFRIQEMFRFQGFHMYGILGSAVAVAALSLLAARRLGFRTPEGAEARIAPKAPTPRNTRYWLGGLVFGLGWALLGACPGPIYALIGTGIWVYAVALLAALAGTWTYAWLSPRLPH